MTRLELDLGEILWKSKEELLRKALLISSSVFGSESCDIFRMACIDNQTLFWETSNELLVEGEEKHESHGRK